MNQRFTFTPLPKPVEMDLAKLDPYTLNCLMGAGTLSSAGPTLAVLAAYGNDDDGKSIPLVLIVLNPFLQAMFQMGVATIEEDWYPAEDLMPFFPIGLETCPTLLLGSRGMGKKERVELFTEFVATFEDGKKEHELVMLFPGEPGYRLCAKMGVLSAPLDGGRKRILKPRAPKGPMGPRQAQAFATLQLKSRAIRKELDAFLDYWQAATDRFADDGGRKEQVMGMDDFFKIFEVLERTLDIPSK